MLGLSLSRTERVRQERDTLPYGGCIRAGFVYDAVEIFVAEFGDLLAAVVKIGDRLMSPGAELRMIIVSYAG